MKIKFLGTAAAEGFPSIFCNCKYCQKARELKGKNIRTRHQTLIDDKLLIDLPADTYFHALSNELRLDKVKYLILTHSHSDHFYPEELEMKVVPYAHNQQSENLAIFGGKGTQKIFVETSNTFTVSGFQQKVIFNYIECYKPVEIGDGYRITSLPARHEFGNDARIYIIEKDGKTTLYAHDTGILYDEIYEYIEKNNIYFDFISLDCTNGELLFPDESSHMGFNQIERVLKKLYEINAIDAKTIKYINHFSHNANPIQEVFEAIAKKYDLKVAFDGEEIDI